jgi:hypothetical protein
MSERRWGRQPIHRVRVHDLPHSTLPGPGPYGGARSPAIAIGIFVGVGARNPAPAVRRGGGPG